MKFFALLAVLTLAACATQPLPDLPHSHPASPDATEAPARPIATNLADDEPTRATDQLLAQPPAAAQ